jgi:hypothetical protein
MESPLFGGVSGPGEAVMTASDDHDVEAVFMLDLDKYTVYKSTALILL